MRRAVALLAAGLLAGCGSTAAVRSTETAGSAGGLAVPGPQSPGASTGPVTAGAADVPGPATGASGPVAVAGGAAPAALATTSGRSGPAGAGQLAGSGPGYSPKEIRVGFTISSDAAKALGGLGLGVQVADQRALVQVWVNRINGMGGIAGRKVVPVIYDYSAAGDVNTQDQAACATFTQDQRVVAATGVRAGTTGSGDTLTPCLAKAGVPWLAAQGEAHKWRAYLAAMYSTSDMNHTREEQTLVESLAAQGFFGSGAKVGVVVSNSQDDMSRAVAEGMVPALRRLGLGITREVVLSNPQTESSNAELQMFASGVTHVLFAAPGGAAASQFMISANSQGRTYRYGISTQDAPGLTVQTLAPKSQLKNAWGYGYRPGLDVDGNNQPPDTTGMRTCFGYYKSKGYDTSSLNRAAMALICDGLDLLQQGFRGIANPSQALLGQRVAGFGDSLPVAGTFSSAFSSTQHDGVGSYRFLRYVTDCSCFRYQGPLRKAP